MNLSLICLSLKYINKNYEVISNISKWIYFELTKSNYNESKIIDSLENKDFEVIKVLIKFNEDIDLLSRYLVEYCSYDKNYFDIVKLLIDNGADIHIGDDFALMWASNVGHLNIVKLLIDNGVDIRVRDNLALIWASENNHHDIVKLLIDNGADICGVDNYTLNKISEHGHIDTFFFLNSEN